MRVQILMIDRLPCFFILLFFLFSLTYLNSHPSKHSEKEKINYLLETLENSNLIFIRNGDEYSSKEARAHMQKKLEYAGNRITNVDQFITYLATKSSISGKPYYVKYPDGKKVESSIWMRELLNNLEEKK
jgi:hypothetical protein